MEITCDKYRDGKIASSFNRNLIQHMQQDHAFEVISCDEKFLAKPSIIKRRLISYIAFFIVNFGEFLENSDLFYIIHRFK